MPWLELRSRASFGVLIEKQRARVAVHGKALLDADGMRRQNRPIPVDVASRDTVAHDEENIMIVSWEFRDSSLICRFRFVSSHPGDKS